MDTVILNNGVEMPVIGFGTYLVRSEREIGEALAIGYRHIDTAQWYGNEHEVGTAVRQSDLSREKIFVTTKLWGCRGYRDTLASIENSLRALDIGYIDLLLIHEPTGNFNEIYRAMETKYREGSLRAIGVSNFMEANFLRLMKTAQIVPAVNQIETHVFCQQREMNLLLKKFGTVHESWSPLACGRGGIFSNATLTKIAQSHGRTVAQIALRFLIQLGVPIIPKSSHKQRMRENFSVTDFELTAAEMDEIRRLDTGKSLFGWW